MAIGSLTSFKNNAVNRLAVDMQRIRKTYQTDSMGNRKANPTESTIDVKVIYDNITKKNLQNKQAGQLLPGNSTIYYDYDQDIQTGDILKWDNLNWKVQRIRSEWFGVYKVAEAMKIDL